MDRDKLRIGVPTDAITGKPLRWTVEEAEARAEALGLENRGKSWQCPSFYLHNHGDQRLSFRIWEGDDGTAAFHCNAGCEFEKYMEVLREADPQVVQEFATRAREGGGRRRKHTPPLPADDLLLHWRNQLNPDSEAVKLAAEHRSTNFETLQRLGVGVHRRGNNNMRDCLVVTIDDPETHMVIGVMSIDPRPCSQVFGVATYAYPGSKRGPYPAPEHEIFDGVEEITFVEGEKDALTLNSLGIPAISVPGANIWHNDWAPRCARFKRANVIMDCDKDGRRCASIVANALSAVIPEVFLIDLDPEVDSGMDVGDLVKEGWSADDIRDLIAEQQEPMEPEEHTWAWGETTPLNIFQEPAPVTYIATPSLGDNLLYYRSLTGVAGHPGSGKSYAMTVCSLDHIINDFHVVYVDFENGKLRMERRLWAMQARDVETFTDRFHYWSRPDVTIGNLTETMRIYANYYPGVLFIFDSMRGLLNALDPKDRTKWDVNDPITIEKAIAPIQETVSQGDMTAVIIDHTAKAGMNQNRYASANSAAKKQVLDAEYYWEEREHFSQKDEGLVAMECTKDRDGALLAERQWMVGGNGDNPLVFTPVDLDEEEDQEDRVEQARVRRMEKTRSRIRGDIVVYLLNAEGDQTFTAIRTNVTGGNDAISEVLDEMVAETNPCVLKIAQGSNATYRLRPRD